MFCAVGEFSITVVSAAHIGDIFTLCLSILLTVTGVVSALEDDDAAHIRSSFCVYSRPSD